MIALKIHISMVAKQDKQLNHGKIEINEIAFI